MENRSKNSAAGFDPFRDRLSRDIRNDLSRALVRSLAEGRRTAVEELGAALLRRELGACRREYVESRLERYRRAFARFQQLPDDAVLRGLVLWDLGLFFEVHEVLEHSWHRAVGDRRMLLQSLIRAAGVYIKLEHGYRSQAAGLAEKATAGLERNRSSLQPYFDPDRLIEPLRALNPDPPILLAGG